MRGEEQLTRRGGIWILFTPFINQLSAHLDQIYTLSGTFVIGDGGLQFGRCVAVNYSIYSLCFLVYVCMIEEAVWSVYLMQVVRVADKGFGCTIFYCSNLPWSFPSIPFSLVC